MKELTLWLLNAAGWRSFTSLLQMQRRSGSICFGENKPDRQSHDRLARSDLVL